MPHLTLKKWTGVGAPVALTRQDIQQLEARLGADNVLSSEADRLVYSTDVGSPPAIVDMLVNRKADVVARCRDIDDVQTVMRFAIKRRIPVTPRAAATSALGGAVPKRAGIVLDLTPMHKRISIDEKALEVSVDAGTVIWDLQQKLLEVGLELPVYPTSGLAATIGGFVASDGHGIHATRAGNIGKWVMECEGVGADGNRFHVREPPERELLVGAGGATGVITRIRLKVVEATKDAPVLIKHKGDPQALIEELTQRWQPKHVMFHNAAFYALRTKGAGERRDPIGSNAVMVCFAENKRPSDEELTRFAERHRGSLVDQKTADAEWQGRFYPIRAKVAGPSLVAGEVFVPVNRLKHYLRALKQKVNVPLSTEGHVTDDGRVYFFIFTLDDERRPNYPLGWGTSAWILSLAKKNGGTAYHPGVWLQWEAKSVFGKTRYRRMKDFKQATDYRNLLNPGMVFPLPAPIPEFVYKAVVKGPTPAPSLGFQLAAGNPMLQYVGPIFKHRAAKTVGVRAADVAGDMARGGGMAIHSDQIWGCDIPSLQAIPNPGDLPMTHTVRGKMVLAKAWVQSKVIDPWTLKSALDVADPDDAEAAFAIDYDKVKPVLDAFRREVESAGVELDVKAVEIVEEVDDAKGGDDAGGEGEMSKEEIIELAKNTPEAEKAWVLAADCIVCNGCEAACPTAAAIVTDMARVDRDLCIADGGCFDACPTGAIRPGEEDKETSAGWPEGSRLAGQFGV